MNKALFLDRDGVINRERGKYTYRSGDFEILPDVIEALRLAKEKGYLVIGISNQGGIAKGLFSKEDVERLHLKLNEILHENGVFLDELYYCPHHDEVGKCICRKPDVLMLEKAIARFNIDSQSSVMIGDSQRDVEAAEKAGVRGVLVESNAGILDIVKGLE